jgi:hypothetical protein
MNVTRLVDARRAVFTLDNDYGLVNWLDNARHPDGHLMGDDPGLIRAFADIGSALRRKGPKPGTITRICR